MVRSLESRIGKRYICHDLYQLSFLAIAFPSMVKRMADPIRHMIDRMAIAVNAPSCPVVMAGLLFWRKYSKKESCLLYLAQMRAYPIIAACLVALSMYVRVYRRMARNFRSRKFTPFNMGGEPSCIAFCIVDYAISRLGRSEKASCFSWTVYNHGCYGIDEFVRIRDKVYNDFKGVMDEHEGHVVEGYFVRIIGIRVSNVSTTATSTIPFQNLRLRVGSDYVCPYNLLAPGSLAKDVLVDHPKRIVADAVNKALLLDRWNRMGVG